MPGKPQQLPLSVAENKKSEELLKGNRRNHKEINRRDRLSVILQKCLPGLRRRERRTMYFETVDWATWKPSIRSSPWIRDAPHSAFSLLIRRIRSRRPRSIFGRPALFRDFQRQNTLQSPFVGTYAAATYGGFFAEGLVRFNYYETNLNSPSINVYDQKLDAHGITVSGSAGYYWAMPNSEVAGVASVMPWTTRAE
jgi:hypothetical protein